MEAARRIDARGQFCPWPIVELSKAIRTIEVGQSLILEATDPAFEPDLRAWVEATGHELLSFQRTEGVMRAYIRKCLER